MSDAIKSAAKILSEQGQGRPVIALGADFSGSAAHAALARRFRVIALDAKDGQAAADWIAGQAFETCGLLGIGEAAPDALTAASVSGEKINALVLVSPRGLPVGEGRADAALGPLMKTTPAPKCVLLGYDDKTLPKNAAALFKTSLSRTNVVLVWEAGGDIAADRPEALASAAGDFLDRQGRFGFMTDSVAVSL